MICMPVFRIFFIMIRPKQQCGSFMPAPGAGKACEFVLQQVLYEINGKYKIGKNGEIYGRKKL